MERKGLIHYYYGDGKGKTTAAFGLAARALGRGMKVTVVQFLKSDPSSEVDFFANADGITVLRGKAGGKFVFAMNDEEKMEAAKTHMQNFEAAIETVINGLCDVLVLDEVSDACKLKVFDEAQLFGFLRDKPIGLEVVMTGHDAMPQFIEIADYVTEMHKIKHPYDAGVRARKGIEK